MRMREEKEKNLFSFFTMDRTSNKRFIFLQQKLQKKFFKISIVKYWNRFTGEIMKSASFEYFKNHFDKI